MFKDAPPLPHPVVKVDVHFFSNASSNDTGRHCYSGYQTFTNSEATEAPREITLENLKNYPEYRPEDEIDASEGRYAAKKYVESFRKASLRKEVHAVAIYKQPLHAPPLNIDWLLIFYVLTFSISIILVCFGVLNIKRSHKIFEYEAHQKTETRRLLERSRSALRLDWILRHIDLQNAYESETQRLRSKVIRLRDRVAGQKTRIRALTIKRIENRSRNTFLVKNLDELTRKVAGLDRTLRYLRSLHDLTMAMMEPEAAFVRRFERDAAEAEEKFRSQIRERPSKARTSPTQWWDEQRRDVEMAIRYIEIKKTGRNWRLHPNIVDRLRAKGLLEPGYFERPAPSQRALKRRTPFTVRE